MPIYVPPYVAPTGTPPLEGSDLEDALHDVIVGITGMDNTLVQPRWQPEPVDIPAAATAWAAFGFERRDTSKYPEVVHAPGALSGGSDILRQQEELDVRVSFYDLGAAGHADQNLALLRDGLYIAQNREAMLAQGIMLVSTGDAVPAPVLFKERWQYRVDLVITIRRQIDRTYAIPNIESAAGNIVADGSRVFEIPFSVEPPP